MKSAHATWRPVAYQGLHDRMPRRAALLHTNGGGSDHGSLFGWWSAGARGDRGVANLHVGAQFQVMNSGHAEQYADSDLVLYHAYGASEWAFGIETEDDNHPATEWTDPQLATIIAILREHKVPPVLLSKPTAGDGVGWHEMFPEWNKEDHHCPDSTREQQIREHVLPSLGASPPHLTVAAVNRGHATLQWTQTPGATSYAVQDNGVIVGRHKAGSHTTGPNRSHGRHVYRILATGPSVRAWSNTAVVNFP